MIEAFDREHLWNAFRLAERGLYTTTPNPRVGCILVRNGEVVGEGWHERAGEAHAEVMALREAGDRARGATAYVTLEPCSHHGRTPPCADTLIEAGVRRVVAAMQDPNPRVSGRGLERLRAAGIEVDCGAFEDEARDLNIGFVTRMQFGRPWVRMKIAATLDGKTALENGVSQWITGPQARRDGHAWRARACALLTGIGTVKEDDPLLTVRDVPTSRQPPRIVVDSRMEIDRDAKILSQGKVLLFAARDDAERRTALEDRGVEVVVMPDANGKVDLRQLILECARREFNELHVEAGFKLNGSLMREGLIDELVVYLAPSIVGDRARGMFALPALDTLAGKTELSLYDLCRVGDDVRIITRVPARSGTVRSAN